VRLCKPRRFDLPCSGRGGQLSDLPADLMPVEGRDGPTAGAMLEHAPKRIDATDADIIGAGKCGIWPRKARDKARVEALVLVAERWMCA
jgi:hypothetical protein